MTTETETKMRSQCDNDNRYLGPLRHLSFIVTSLIIGSVYFDYFPLKIVFHDERNELSFENRLKLTIQLTFLDLIPLIFSIFSVIRIRMRTVAMNPLDPRGHLLVEKQQNILRNTVEQLMIKLIISLNLSIILHHDEFILLPIFTFLFLVGRLTFAIGYPFYRSFGISMNILASIIFACFISYRFLTEQVSFYSIQWK